MNPFSALISRVLADGLPGLRKLQEKGIQPEWMKGEENQIALRFILDYHRQYGGVPGAEALAGYTSFVATEVPQEPLEFFADTILDIRLRGTLEGVHKGFSEKLSALSQGHSKSDTLVEFLEEELRKLRKDNPAFSKVEPISVYAERVLDYYDMIKSGARGILSPWASVNDATMGWWPQDFVLFVARVAIGKTWLAILLSHCAWEQGKKVLFASTEISKLRISLRAFSRALKLPYPEFRSGRMDMFTEQRLRDNIASVYDDRYMVVGGSFDFRSENFEAAIEESEPDLVVLDGAYLLKVPGSNRMERAANAMDELKRIALRKEVPILATHQFNREVKANDAKSPKIESIGLTDVASWNADVIYALVQTEDMKTDRVMGLKPLKVREGLANEIKIRWDLENMDFTEIAQADAFGGGGDADEPPPSLPPPGGEDDSIPF